MFTYKTFLTDVHVYNKKCFLSILTKVSFTIVTNIKATKITVEMCDTIV